MASIDDLERAVAKLRREINRLKGNPAAANQAVVAEIIGTDETPGGGFAKACAELAANSHARDRSRAIDELRSGQVLTPYDEHIFRERYKSIHDIDALIANHRAGIRVE